MLSQPKIFIRLLVLSPRHAASHSPASTGGKKKIKKSNILGMVDLEGKKIGIHLVCSMNKGFDEIESAEDIIAGINKKELMDFKEQIAGILHKDLVGNIEEKEQ